MDEAFVVLVANQQGVCQAFPFTTKAAAEQAREWFTAAFGGEGAVHTSLIDDHEPLEPVVEEHAHDGKPEGEPDTVQIVAAAVHAERAENKHAPARKK